MVSAKPALRAEPALCSGAAPNKPPFDMGVVNFVCRELSWPPGGGDGLPSASPASLRCHRHSPKTALFVLPLYNVFALISFLGTIL